MRGDRHEHGRCWKRRVQEQPHAIAQPKFAQGFGQAQQVVIMRPDHIVRSHQAGHRLTKLRVHPAIGPKVSPVEMRVADLIVQRRPQRTVGEAAIEPVVVGSRKIDRVERDCPSGPFHMCRRGGVIANLAAPSKPDTALLLQCVQHAGGEPAGGWFPFRDRRHPVGDDDQARQVRRLPEPVPPAAACAAVPDMDQDASPAHPAPRRPRSAPDP